MLEAATQRSCAVPDPDFFEYPFVTPDQCPVAYSLPGEKYKRWKATERFWNFKPFFSKWQDCKICNMKLHFREGKWRKQFFIVADIDKLLNMEQRQWVEIVGSRLAGPKARLEDIWRRGYEALRNLLQERLGDKAYVYCSVDSGQPKVIFLIEYPEAIKHPTIKDALTVFEHYLPEYVEARVIDTTASGIFTTFVPFALRDEFMDTLRHLPPIKVKKPSKSDLEVEAMDGEMIALPPSDYQYSIAETLPRELDFNKFSLTYRKFFRVLLTMTSLTRRSGFGISQLVLCRTLNITQATASYYLNATIRMGLLKVINDRYCPGKKAKTYSACGALRRAIMTRLEQRKPFKLPKRIHDGDWHRSLLQALTKAFRRTPGRFLSWVKTLPDHQIKDRLYQADRLYDWYIHKYPHLASA